LARLTFKRAHREWSGPMTLNAAGSSSDAALVYNEAPWARRRVVGRGNFGKARLLENEDTGELVVCKEAKLDGSEEARRKQSSDWSKEVELHSKLCHPHIIGYRGSFQQSDMFCIVMDYAAGGTLDGRIAQQKEAGEPFCADMILRWLAEMASALEHMHSHRVLHRDMKPANVLLSTEGEIKLADFGVSRLLGSQTSLAQTVLGTPFYMSPELFKGEPYSQPTDVWALGVILFELLTLQRCAPPPPSPPSPPSPPTLPSLRPSWPAMVCHGRPWPAMAGHGLPWPAIAAHGLPWPATACHVGPKTLKDAQRSISPLRVYMSRVSV
jgi:serine/threonine protein kinase